MKADAHLAALLPAHGAHTFYNARPGLRRFDFLDVRNPVPLPDPESVAEQD